MKRPTRKKSFSVNQIGPNLSSDSTHGKWYPSKKSVTQRPESTSRFTYSAAWKRPQRMPEYSVWYPATSSVSASGRSNDAPDDLRDEEPERRLLLVDDFGQVQRLPHHHDAEHAQRERHLVGDELRARAHRAEDRVLRLGGPAADDEAVDAERAEREDQDQRDREVRDRALDVVAVDGPAGAPGQHAEREQRREHRDHGRDDVERLLGGGRRERLLADQLQQVGDRHEQALGAGAVRPVAQLHAAEQLSLEPGREREEQHHDVDDDECFRNRDPPRLGHAFTSTVGCRSAAWSTAMRTTPASRSRAICARSSTDVPFEETVT